MERKFIQTCLVAWFITLCLFMCSGCNLVKDAASNVVGWDVSACVEGFDVCWELFWDNSDKFEDGFVGAMDTIGSTGD